MGPVKPVKAWLLNALVTEDKILVALMFSKYFKVHGEQHIAQEAYIAVSMYTAYR